MSHAVEPFRITRVQGKLFPAQGDKSLSSIMGFMAPGGMKGEFLGVIEDLSAPKKMLVCYLGKQYFIGWVNSKEFIKANLYRPLIVAHEQLPAQVQIRLSQKKCTAKNYLISAPDYSRKKEYERNKMTLLAIETFEKNLTELDNKLFRKIFPKFSEIDDAFDAYKRRMLSRLCKGLPDNLIPHLTLVGTAQSTIYYRNTQNGKLDGRNIDSSHLSRFTPTLDKQRNIAAKILIPEPVKEGFLPQADIEKYNIRYLKKAFTLSLISEVARSL